MVRTPRLSMTGALIVCLMATQWSGTLFASQEDRPSNAAPLSATSVITASEQPPQPSRLVFSDRIFDSVELEGLGQRGGYRGRGNGRNGAAAAAIIIGAAASIAGGAVLVYANRPECSANHAATGCGYGSKVTGTAVLSAGIVSLIVGALSWR
jgi:hypothetical protein